MLLYKQIEMEVVKMASVHDVAKYILDKKGSITTMKLQKLVYYCQAWALAWDEIPLFDEDFQAWANGPVCVQLYNKHKGLFEVSANMYKDEKVHCFTEGEQETMDIVLRDYGDETPHYLSELTHKERPWREARGNTPLGEPSSSVISKEIIRDYYSGLIAG